ncbi:alcohol dehydogenase [Rhodocollybia butyracea]|uniref:Alcohol dehydogenase n=1 Tax=Rhodocollybia butyracea TaxID=206335 RepID=A0A9P5Q5F2_9AGAR|nr:alcohol dehydogenase [Rhodocollybia butyracea]
MASTRTLNISSREEMDAYRWFPNAQTLTYAKVAVPQPAHDEVLVKVLAAGMCHSDMLYYDESFKHTNTKPFTMGHEGAGELVALGESVPSMFPELRLNQYVVIHSRNACYLPDCPHCSIGADNHCRRHLPCGLGIDGSYAPYVAVPARTIVPVNATTEVISPPVAAVSTDAVLTSYHALKDLKAGATVLIIGIGGLGMNAIQIAKNLKKAKTVIVSDTRDVTFQAALKVGADYAAKPEDLASLISSNNLTVDTVCDFVGITATFHISSPLPPKELSIKTNIWGTKKELAEVLAEVKALKITPVIETRPLSKAVETFEDMRNSKLTGRVVLIP